MSRATVPFALLAGLLAAGPGPVEGHDALWTVTWNSPASLDDTAQDTAVDSSGNVFVAGWTDRTDIGEDRNILVLKYSPGGVLLWTRTHNGIPGGYDLGFGVAVDRGGNCYVAGSVSITGGASNAWLRKYDPAGNVLWTVEYPSPSPGDQAVFRDVAVDDATGNVYAAGCQGRGDILQAGNALLVKVGPGGGAPIWVADADGLGRWDEFMAVAVAPNGDVLVAGYEGVADTAGVMATYGADIVFRTSPWYYTAISTVDNDIVACRYTAAGSPVWRRTFGSLNGTSDLTWDQGFGVAAGVSGEVFVSGIVASKNSAPVGYDRWIRGWAADGNSVLWTRVISEALPPDEADTGSRCATGPDGRVFVAGTTAHAGTYQAWDMTVEQFAASSGFSVHGDSYSSGNFIYDEGKAVAVDGTGAVVLAGSSYRSDIVQGWNVVVRRYPAPVTEVQAAGKVVAYPNPYDPGRAVGGVFKFANLPERASIGIWTPAGLLVARVEVRGRVAGWDGRTGAGAPAAPGIYHYTVEAPGTKTVTGTVFLVRR